MVDKNVITNWLITHKDLFKLSYKQYDWTDRYSLGLHDFSCHLDLENIKSEGRGTSTDSELAIEKASAEAIERYICLKLNIPSVGVAVSGEKSALVHAQNEVLERYYLNNHIELKWALKKISLTNHLTNPLSVLLNKINSNFGMINVDFYQMHTPLDKFGVICSIQNLNSNFYSFGFSFNSELSIGLERSFLEAIPNNFAAINDEANDSDLHARPWHLSDDFKACLLPLLTDSVDYADKNFPLSSPQIEIEPINMDLFPELRTCPINPVRVKTLNSSKVEL